MGLSRPSYTATAERLCALIILVCITSPLLILIAVFIRISAGRPIVLRDRYTRRDGSIAHRHRFRTTGPGTTVFHVVGRFLRAYALDEVPAFWDVLRGDVSLADLLASIHDPWARNATVRPALESNLARRRRRALVDSLVASCQVGVMLFMAYVAFCFLQFSILGFISALTIGLWAVRISRW